MEQVTQFFLDENSKKNKNNKTVAQTVRGIFEEDKAIDDLKVKVKKGRYILGYEKQNGERKIFENSKQVVQEK